MTFIKLVSCILTFSVIVVGQVIDQSANDTLNNIPYTCDIAKCPSRYLNVIAANAPDLYLISDTREGDCFFVIADSIKKIIIDYDNIMAYVALDSLLKYSDGFYAEYFDDVLPAILRVRFKSLLTYLDNNKKSNLEQFLIWGLYHELGFSNDTAKKRREFNKWINKMVKTDSIPAGQVKHLKNILKKVDKEIKKG